MISDQPSDEPFAFPSDFPGIVAGSAIIVPSSTLQDPPTLDLKGFQANVSASIGRTAYLGCKVKNLGHKSVSHQSKLYIINLIPLLFDAVKLFGHFTFLADKKRYFCPLAFGVIFNG